MPLTRRKALELAAGAGALGLLRPGRARAADRTDSFAMPLDAGDGAVAAGGWRTTRVFTAPRRFDLIGLAWARSSSARAQVRARRSGGRWTRWTELPVAGDHGPDAGRVGGTDPVWTGTAEEFQLRLLGNPRRLRAQFVRSPRRRGVRALAAGRRQTGAPPIIPRAAWGGDAVVPRESPAYGQVQLAFVHHTVNANDYGPEDSAAMVLGIARYHRDHNGWNDIGYHFLVDQYGQIFEGRAGGVDQPIVGAQAQGFNSVSTGIACLGTFSTVAWPEAGLEAVGHLLGWKLSVHGVPVQGQVTVTSAGGETNRFPAGTPVTFERVSGHRDGNATECPGNVLYGQLDDLRARAARHAFAPAGLTLRAARTSVRGVVPTELSGVLRFADGTPGAGAPVELHYAAGGGMSGAPVATAICAADGSWRATVTLTQSGTLQARFPGDGAHPPLESPLVAITVRPALDVELSTSHLRRGRRLRLSGSVAPEGDAVELLLYRKSGRRYRRIRRRRLTVRDGRFSASLRLGRRTLYRVTVRVPGASVRRYVRVIR